MSIFDFLIYILIGLFAIYLGNVIGLSVLKEKTPNVQFPDGFLFFMPFARVYFDFCLLRRVYAEKEQKRLKSLFSNPQLTNILLLTAFSETYQEVLESQAETERVVENIQAHSPKRESWFAQKGRDIKSGFNAMEKLMTYGAAS